MLSIFRRIFHQTAEPKVLGRWSLVYDNKLARKADLSNEDHCGPCGTYVLQQNQKNIQKMHIINKKQDKNY